MFGDMDVFVGFFVDLIVDLGGFVVGVNYYYVGDMDWCFLGDDFIWMCVLLGGWDCGVFFDLVDIFD